MQSNKNVAYIKYRETLKNWQKIETDFPLKK